MNKLKKAVLSTVSMIVALSNCCTVNASDLKVSYSVENNSNYSNDSGFGYIIVEHTSGKVDKYSIDDMLGECMYVDNENIIEDDASMYIINSSSYESQNLSANSASSSTHYIDWNCKKNVTTICNEELVLSVYDTVSYELTPYTNNYFDMNVGLWNNVNHTFISLSDVFGSAGGLKTSSYWTMAVGGYFSFAIRVNKTTVDDSIRVAGSYSF